MESSFFLGIDGGQSSTISALCGPNGRLLGIGHAGPSNHIHEPGGLERLRSALAESIRTAWTSAGLGDPEVKLPCFHTVCCGMTGGLELVPALIQHFAHIDRLLVHEDMVTAYAGALAGQPGVVVIAGTGSVAYGVNTSGCAARAGGWAYLMGDEGSGYDIGRQALVATARAEDGRDVKTLLYERILAHFHTQNFWEVRNLVYSDKFDRSQVAKLSPLVGQAALEGDPTAIAILEKAGVSLAEIALAVLKNLGMEDRTVDVSYVGGVFRTGALVLEPFRNCLHRQHPAIRVQPPLFSPVIGALLMAMREGGVHMNASVIEQLCQADRLVEKI
jgi:N-acetylglucosamine kinase-like BadF-type ATPase